ncbi:MAG TPA: hypothetical protein VMH28_13595, partial [Candidatus Acidoferrales bacterium]|nr:hypothetical protein [Candidatus Acidoferrales bacterium]
MNGVSMVTKNPGLIELVHTTSPLRAVGKTFRNGWNEISGPIQIVGVVKDTKYTSLRAEGEAIAYYPL